MIDILPPPAPLNRPKFARFIWERGLDYRAAGRSLGRTGEWVRLICLPFDDPRRRTPDPDDVEKIREWTDGQVEPADWYPPRSNAAASDVRAAPP